MSYLMVVLGLGAAAAFGYGSPSACADSPTWSDYALLDFAPSGFALPTDDASPILNASATAITDDFDLASQAMAGGTANPLVSAADDFSSALNALLDGVSPAPSDPGVEVGFSGSPSLLDGLLVSALQIAKPFENFLGIDTMSLTSGLTSASPPLSLTSLEGLTVTETNEDGMPVYDLTPADPSGQYVVAIHGGGYVEQPSDFHWLAYAEMAHQTGATVVVPIYPLAPEGTAGTVEPEMASLISSEIAAEGPSHVSVYGDSAGGGMALSAVQLLVSEGKPVPESMVLDSPTLDLTMSNPNISLIDDPILNLADGDKDSLLWAGDLPLTNPLVSPIDGSLEGLPSTYVYSGSDELLAPDVLVLEKDAIAQDAPISFILRSGEMHDWALTPLLDGAQVQPQIYQELGLTDASASASASEPEWFDGLQNLATELSSGSASSGFSLGDLSTDVANALTTVSTDITALSGDLSSLVADALTLF